MLNKIDYVNTFKKLLAVYGDNSEKSHGKMETFKIYYGFFIDFSKEELENGIDLLIREETNPFFPTVAVIIKYIEKAKNMGLDKDIIEELKMVQKITGRKFESNELNNLLENKKKITQNVLAN